MLIPDEDHLKTVKIPVRMVGGILKPFYGGPWPPVREGAIGDLILPEYAFLRAQDAKILNAPLTFQILRKWTRLLVGVRHPALPTLKCSTIEIGSWGHYDGFVEVHLREKLYLQLRGTKKAWLRPCECFIPSLKTKAESLNEAYTKISEAYEPWRRSHSGNVFTHVFYQAGKPRELVWDSLDSVRTRMEMKLESRFQHRSAEAAEK